MSKMMSWFTPTRRKYLIRSCVTAFGVTTFALSVVIHGPYQENIRNWYNFYKNGKPKALSEEVEKLAKEVLNDSNLNEEQKKKITFFNVIGQDLFHLGGTNSPWGASIGLPFYFEKEVNFAGLRLHGHETIDWIIEGHDLLNAFTLSDKAKKFGIMREIYACNIWDAVDNAFISSSCILISAILAQKINAKRDQLNKLTFKNRFVVYLFCFTIGVTLYRLLKDPLKHLSNKKSDELAALTGSDYLEGGIEFYEHMILRNKVLRNLLGKTGERQFKEDGDENYFIITPKLPTLKRLELLKELQEKNKKK